MPSQKSRETRTRGDHGADSRRAAPPQACKKVEPVRKKKFQLLCNLVQRFAPPGKWLDIGCGTGALVEAAMELGVEIEGIEPMSDRRELAGMLTGATIYGRQLELMDFAPGSFAAVTLTDVFSHLYSPADTLSRIHHILQPGGILLLYTSEIGAGVARHHNYSWNLGDHRYYLGDQTIERYARKTGFEVVCREKKWAPDMLYSHDSLLTNGRSKLRNVIKKSCAYTPGVLPVLRWYMLKIRNKNNPHYVSTLVLKKEHVKASPVGESLQSSGG
ncbi:MAG: class I SAM-dependent methyltransferase [Planctomycetota bacterium]|jgi:SAM-dependent methyltransferase